MKIFLFILLLGGLIACSDNNSVSPSNSRLKVSDNSVRAGDVVSISGQGIGSTANSVQIYIGNDEVNVLSRTGNQIRFMIPRGAQGKLTVQINGRITDFPDFSIHKSVIYALGINNQTGDESLYQLDGSMNTTAVAGVRKNSSAIYNLGWTTKILSVAVEFSIPVQGNVYHFQQIDINSGVVDSVTTSHLTVLSPALTIDETGNRVIGFATTVSGSSGQFVMLNVGDASLQAALTPVVNIADFERGIIMPGSGYLYGLGYLNASDQNTSLFRINLSAATVKSYALQSEYSGLTLNPFTNAIYTLDIVNRQLIVIDSDDGSVTQSWPFPPSVMPYQLTYVPESDEILVLANLLDGGVMKNYIYQVNGETGVMIPVELSSEIFLSTLITR